METVNIQTFLDLQDSIGNAINSALQNGDLTLEMISSYTKIDTDFWVEHTGGMTSDQDQSAA